SPHYLRPIRLIQTISSTTSLPIPLVAPGSVRVDLVTPNAITQETRLPCQPSFRDGLPDLLRVCPPCRHGRTRQGGPVRSGAFLNHRQNFGKPLRVKRVAIYGAVRR